MAKERDMNVAAPPPPRPTRLSQAIAAVRSLLHPFRRRPNPPPAPQTEDTAARLYFFHFRRLARAFERSLSQADLAPPARPAPPRPYVVSSVRRPPRDWRAIVAAIQDQYTLHADDDAIRADLADPEARHLIRTNPHTARYARALCMFGLVRGVDLPAPRPIPRARKQDATRPRIARAPRPATASPARPSRVNPPNPDAGRRPIAWSAPETPFTGPPKQKAAATAPLLHDLIVPIMRRMPADGAPGTHALAPTRYGARPG